mmetsp:Transcript_38835/g.60538  ORF Transcript_38835/g.60538 Transcript_38835/m.60538 type:complete len:204 (+) Transcript_38835:660-1271(+)|eukprot:CAMPEP_0184322036 /NCGR_PEP_ID=MMETSP1049-20130417/122506_1 /TAXON_ID=77928 /ORGANISM="Proteomonas sulcata, Strain CCMP704" /LENGTH=203 /DNA_ID=CAMNT_0026643041 /DNA_START=1482 /DNA_END=2093 /DNA_ORIENTATION=-
MRVSFTLPRSRDAVVGRSSTSIIEDLVFLRPLRFLEFEDTGWAVLGLDLKEAGVCGPFCLGLIGPALRRASEVGEVGLVGTASDVWPILGVMGLMESRPAGLNDCLRRPGDCLRLGGEGLSPFFPGLPDLPRHLTGNMIASVTHSDGGFQSHTPHLGVVKGLPIKVFCLGDSSAEFSAEGLPEWEAGPTASVPEGVGGGAKAL